MRILVAEDQKDLNDIIVKELRQNHYTVDSCYDGEAALDYIRCAEYDAVILDIMMPRKTGIEVVKQLRRDKNHVPVLLLTALDSIEDRVTGLDAGADDYLIKPFALDELTARIRVMLRRASGHVSNCFTVANLKVDCDKRTVFRDETEIVLSSKEFAVLEYMIRNQGIVLTREKIEQHIWNYDYEGGSNVVNVYIRYLRKKIDDNFEPKLIHTIRGTGYVLRENV
ncbi:MAG: response regulator transcription factor [Oliverpabstia sp.]|nr:response regulator transcription factor [Lachnospiraceae bacterium]MDY5025282.1 response regulator transcription factor [Oliverpabstia sp.]